MTTEETELTFVRCPSCRSLVPAVATKCRMCGHAFEEGQGKPADYAEPQRKSRVRQRTVSVAPEEVEEITEKVLAERESAPSGASPYARHREAYGFSEPSPSEQLQSESAPPSFSSRFNFDEPAGEPSEPSEQTQEQSAESPAAAAVYDSPDYASENFFGLPSAQEGGAEEEADSREGAFSDPEPVIDEDQEQAGESDLEADSDADDQSLDSEAKSGGKRKRRRRRRRRKDTGSAAREGLDESEQEDDELDEEGQRDSAAEHQASDYQAPPESAAEFAQEREPEPVPDVFPDSAAVAEEQGSVELSENLEKSREGYMATQELGSTRDGAEKHAKPAASPQRYSAERTVSDDAQSGHLVGWLVSYSQNHRGAGTELRSGKYFIGRQQLRADDLVIADTAVSTPHCLVSASTTDGLKIQDLMSEQGTFVKRRGSQNFERIHDVVDVEHGDTLRFGAYEVLICLVP